MKNVLILGLVALLLFSVSAALSLWLNPPKPATEETTAAAKATPRKSSTKEKDKASADDEKAGDAPRSVFRPKSNSTAEEAGQMSAQLREQLASLKEREGRLDKRQAQIDLVLQDIRGERQVIEDLRKQLTTELKQVIDKTPDPDKRTADGEAQPSSAPKNAADAAKRTADAEDERKNMERIAAINESMPAENAARVLQQLADGGNLDTAVRLLNQMKERQAAKVLAAVSETDTALAAQLLTKMRSLKRPTPPPGPNGS